MSRASRKKRRSVKALSFSPARCTRITSVVPAAMNISRRGRLAVGSAASVAAVASTAMLRTTRSANSPLRARAYCSPWRITTPTSSARSTTIV